MVTAIVGANWGDEGKGKITDLLASESDIAGATKERARSQTFSQVNLTS